MINLINIAKSSTQFIFNNSRNAVTCIASRVNKIFISTINKFNDAIRSLSSFIFGKPKMDTSIIPKYNPLHRSESLPNLHKELKKADISAFYRKGQVESKDELKILTKNQVSALKIFETVRANKGIFNMKYLQCNVKVELWM